MLSLGRPHLSHIGGSMTKARLIKALDGLPDDTRILISGVRITDEVLSAEYVQIDNDGSGGGIAEVTILGVGKKHPLVPKD